MFRVLLADDNKISLKYFADIIDWEKHGFEIVSKAVDGEEAWLDFQKFLPELVITDIQMPSLTGIELAERIARHAPDTVVIFLSSYSEFGYVRSALQLNVFDYLLKHETEKGELLKKLEAVKAQLAQKRKLHTFQNEEAFYLLLRGVSVPRKEGKTTIAGSYALYYVEQDHILPVVAEVLGVSSEEIHEREIKHVFYGHSDRAEALIRLSPFGYLALMTSAPNVHAQACALKEALEQAWNEPFSVVVLQEGGSADDAVNAYRGIQPLLIQKIFYPPASVLPAAYFQPMKLPADGYESRTELLDAIEGCGAEQAARLAGREYMITVSLRDDEGFFAMTRAFLSWLLLRRQAIDLKDGHPVFSFDESDRDEWRDALSTALWVKRKTEEVEAVMRRRGPNALSPTASAAAAYIYAHFADPELSVERVALHTGTSVSNINAVFKRETGETLWKHIVKVRMKRARELLDGGEHKITEVCGLVGYRTLSYFSKVFRATYGMTPKDYRRRDDEKKAAGQHHYT